MSKAATTPERSKGTSPDETVVSHRLTEGLLILFLFVCLYFLLAMLTYNTADPGWSYSSGEGVVSNAAGRTGAWLADVFFSLFGYMAYLFPLMLGLRAWQIFKDRRHGLALDWVILAIRFVGMALVIISGTGLSEIHSIHDLSLLPQGDGGIIGAAIGNNFLSAFNLLGSRLVLVAIFLFGMTVFTDLSWLHLMDRIGIKVLAWSEQLRHFILEKQRQRSEAATTKKAQVERQEKTEAQLQKIKEKRKPPVVVAPPPAPAEPSKRAQQEKQGKLFDAPVTGELPPLGLLDNPEKDHSRGFSQESLEAMSRLLELKLADFGVEAEVVAVLPGPVVTRFEVQPAAGVKVSKITGLAKDLARSLAVISVRVVEVIPGKAVIGIEIPNEDRATVYLGEVLSSKAYEEAGSMLSLALGHDIAGEPVVVDLAKMPHLLVAGTTGSGKSVGVNGMLISLLYKASPADVRLLLVDPKMLELSVYEGIPHLLAPVVTDMKEAANGLRWCVAEMERRYRLMAALGVRNLAGYNRKVKDAEKDGTPIPDPLWKAVPVIEGDSIPEQTAPNLEALPFIVVVIDEFADMMMVVGKKVEELIARIAQKARAAGIHLILATQRPSVDVITGLIKANIPTRISFQVSSKVDSRTILDQGGGEQLLGHGDMLYLPAGTAVPVRVHGAFISDAEVHRVVADWKKRGEPAYIQSILDDGAGDGIPGLTPEGDGNDDPESDPLYDEAVQFVLESRRASISAVQRKLRIGYNRAARLIETMEAAGLVSGMGTNGSREVLAGGHE
ncbi:MAG TPA: DNA translocase FtsK 4TM domain-containing protein [Pseudomonadales bacterium]